MVLHETSLNRSQRSRGHRLAALPCAARRSFWNHCQRNWFPLADKRRAALADFHGRLFVYLRLSADVYVRAVSVERIVNMVHVVGHSHSGDVVSSLRILLKLVYDDRVLARIPFGGLRARGSSSARIGESLALISCLERRNGMLSFLSRNCVAGGC